MKDYFIRYKGQQSVPDPIMVVQKDLSKHST